MSHCIPPLASVRRGILGVTTDLGAPGTPVLYALDSKGAGALNSSPTVRLEQ